MIITWCSVHQGPHQAPPTHRVGAARLEHAGLHAHRPRVVLAARHGHRQLAVLRLHIATPTAHVHALLVSEGAHAFITTPWPASRGARPAHLDQEGHGAGVRRPHAQRHLHGGVQRRLQLVVSLSGGLLVGGGRRGRVAVHRDAQAGCGREQGDHVRRVRVVARWRVVEPACAQQGARGTMIWTSSGRDAARSAASPTLSHKKQPQRPPPHSQRAQVRGLCLLLSRCGLHGLRCSAELRGSTAFRAVRTAPGRARRQDAGLRIEQAGRVRFAAALRPAEAVQCAVDGGRATQQVRARARGRSAGQAGGRGAQALHAVGELHPVLGVCARVARLFRPALVAWAKSQQNQRKGLIRVLIDLPTTCC